MPRSSIRTAGYRGRSGSWSRSPTSTRCSSSGLGIGAGLRPRLGSVHGVPVQPATRRGLVTCRRCLQPGRRPCRPRLVGRRRPPRRPPARSLDLGGSPRRSGRCSCPRRPISGLSRWHSRTASSTARSARARRSETSGSDRRGLWSRSLPVSPGPGSERDTDAPRSPASSSTAPSSRYRASLRARLGRMLGDPSLEIGYPLAGRQARRRRRPADRARRRRHTARPRGRDASPCCRTAAACSTIRRSPRRSRGAARLALEHERLQAELRAELEELRASRTRVVAAGDDERHRLERDLHDGAQQRLVALSLRLGLLRSTRRRAPRGRSTRRRPSSTPRSRACARSVTGCSRRCSPRRASPRPSRH